MKNCFGNVCQSLTNQSYAYFCFMPPEMNSSDFSSFKRSIQWYSILTSTIVQSIWWFSYIFLQFQHEVLNILCRFYYSYYYNWVKNLLTIWEDWLLLILSNLFYSRDVILFLNDINLIPSGAKKNYMDLFRSVDCRFYTNSY